MPTRQIIAIVQARMGSTHLPRKVMLPIGTNIPMIEILLSRLSHSKEIDQVIVATSTDHRNKPLVEHVKGLGFDVFQGSERDVLQRYYQAASSYSPDAIVRITGDCPLVDPEVVDLVVKQYKSTGADYVSNVIPQTYPDGLDVEVFSMKSLIAACEQAETSFQREHVTPYIRDSGNFKVSNVAYVEDYSIERWTVDEPEDYEVVKLIFEYFSPEIHFSWKDVIELKDSEPERFLANKHVVQNEGATMGTGQKLWRRAKRVISGDNILLFKRTEMFLPEQWPTYFSKSKGCKVWDLDGREYIDMSIVSNGANILGYGHYEVDEAVVEVVQSGNMSTLNCPEEVYLAERLIELHSWADMVRLARTGGEANDIAIHVARAASGKDKVAVCGYHSWHDWYLATNLSDKNGSNDHLLPGLESLGVPQELREKTLLFRYNNFEELEQIVKDNDIGVIKMEVQHDEPPQNGFLQKVRKLATDKNIVLIFDECTSGFRETFGGLHKKYDVEPDVAVFGKSLGNGYSISGIVGRRAVMEAAQSIFINNTFWTERVGPIAALKTLDIMERDQSWGKITSTGLGIRDRWQRLADLCGLIVDHWGLPAMTGFSIQSPYSLVYKAFITQEMLTKGYLSTNIIYVSTEHTDEVIDGYFEALAPLFMVIQECEEGRDPLGLLDGPVFYAGFKRLN